jgi:putative hydrolase of the HAD superfamily
MNISTIAFDADDTLWENEALYRNTERRFKSLLAKYIPTDDLESRLFATEIGNLDYFGYGIKSFILSMIETAGKETEGCISVQDILEIVQFAKDMLDAPIQLLPGVREVVADLSRQFSLMIITKGDLLDQQRKLNRSGLSAYFDSVEIVIDKNTEVYASLLHTHQISPDKFLMVGNSLRSDILPVVALGAKAVHIPSQLTWAHEHDIAHFSGDGEYYEISRISELPELLLKICEQQ